MVEVSVALYKPDFIRVGEQLTDLACAGAKRIHLDVMDGQKGRDLTYGRTFCEDVTSYAHRFGLVVESHIMVANPLRFLDFPGDVLVFHYEDFTGQQQVAEASRVVRERGKKFGVAFEPETELFGKEDVFSITDQLLVMTASTLLGNPEFHEDALRKVALLKAYRMASERSYEISVDGRIDDKRAARAVQEGADVVVSGSYVLGSPNSKDAVQKLRGIVSVDA